MRQLKDIFDKLYSFYWKNIGWRLNYFKYSIQNLIRWFPIIWKDRDWDDYFIWEILKTKLKHQAKYIGDRDRHTQAQYDAQRMMWCVRLIDKIQDEYYELEKYDYQKSEFNFVDIPGDPEHKELKIDLVWENYDDYFNKYKGAVKRLKLLTTDDKDKSSLELGIYNEKRAQDLLFQILNRDIRKWWD